MIEKDFVMSFERYSAINEGSITDETLYEMEDELDTEEDIEDVEDVEELNEELDEIDAEYITRITEMEDDFISDIEFDSINESEETGFDGLDIILETAVRTASEDTISDLLEAIEVIEDEMITEAKSSKLQKAKAFLKDKLSAIGSWFAKKFAAIKAWFTKKNKNAKTPAEKKTVKAKYNTMISKLKDDTSVKKNKVRTALKTGGSRPAGGVAKKVSPEVKTKAFIKKGGFRKGGTMGTGVKRGVAPKLKK